MPNTDLAYHPLVEQRYPLLASAILAGASQQLRNMASTGGNLLQRTRCYYFYDTATPCNKREPGTGCSAIDGVNRMHAILGASEACIATHPSDMCVALAALDATVHVTGPAASASIAFADFHRLPGDTPQRDTNLAAGRDHHGDRAAGEGFCGALHLSEAARPAVLCVRAGLGRGRAGARGRARSSEARFALGGVAHKPWRDLALRRCCAGKRRPRQTFGAPPTCCCATRKVTRTTTSRSTLARRAIVRALTQAARRHAAIAADKKIR